MFSESALRLKRSFPVIALAITLLGAANAASAQAGKAWAWGGGFDGQLGNGTVTGSATPVPVSNITDVVQVSAGGSHSLALKLDGTVWAWGDNLYGSLGNGTTVNRYTPQKVAGLANVVQVVGAGSSSYALKSDGSVWAWGANSFGQLGDGTAIDKKRPTQVRGLANVAQIAAGEYHSLALKLDGTAWAWGFNRNGQLGNGALTDSYVPVQVAGFDAPVLANVVQIAAGGRHSLALLKDGSAWGWGENASGQIGDGTDYRKRSPVRVSQLNGVVQLSAGSYHSLALKSDGTLWAWGENNEGELGDGTRSHKSSPVQVATLSNVIQVIGGGYLSHAWLQDGSVWGWGYNADGRLLDGTRKNRLSPMQMPALQGQTVIALGEAHSLSVQAAPQDTRLNPASASAPFGKAFPVSAALINALGGTPLNAPLAFSIDGNSVGTANTTLGGVASLHIPANLAYTTGTHTLSVAFGGDRFYNASSGSVALVITPADVLIKTSLFAGRPGDAKNLYATLKRKTDNASLANKTLVFKADGNPIGTATTDGTGKAVLFYRFDEAFAVGSHTLAAEFSGDSDHNQGMGTGALKVIQAPSAILGSSVSGKAGATVILKAKLTRKTDSALLAGRLIRFQIDGADAGDAVTDGATLTALAYTIPANLSKGAHVLTALFDGDALYLGSENAKTLTVK